MGNPNTSGGKSLSRVWASARCSVMGVCSVNGDPTPIAGVKPPICYLLPPDLASPPDDRTPKHRGTSPHTPSSSGTGSPESESGGCAGAQVANPRVCGAGLGVGEQLGPRVPASPASPGSPPPGALAHHLTQSGSEPSELQKLLSAMRAAGGARRRSAAQLARVTGMQPRPAPARPAPPRA